jgi:WD40 repeat protein
VRDPEFSQDGRWLATIGSGNAVYVWEVATSRRIGRVLAHRSHVNTAKFSPDGKLIVAALADGTAKIWETATGQSVGPPLVHDHELTSAVFSLDGRWIATASGAKVHLWEAATGHALAPPLIHHADVTCVRFSSDGYRIVTASDDRTARIWELSEGQPAGPLPADEVGRFPEFYAFKHEHGSRSLQFNPQQLSVAVVDQITRARVWGPIHEKRITSASFSPDGRCVATTSDDGTLWIWDAARGNALIPAISDVQTMSFSPDGRRFATTTFRNQAQVWDSASGQTIGAAMIHAGPVNSALFSPDGFFVVTASADKSVRVWESATGREVGPPLKHRAGVTYAGFEDSGQSIVTYSGDERWRWNVAPDSRDDDDFTAMIRLLSARELDKQGGIQPVSPAELDELRDRFRGRFPDEFRAATPDIVRDWRLRQIDDAESKNHWSAIAFHLNQLLAQEPASAPLTLRRAIARLNAGLNSGQASPLDEKQLAAVLDPPANLEELARVDPLWWCCDSHALLLVGEKQGEKIAEFLSAALQLGPDDLDWWTIPASTALVAGNRERHQQVCRETLARFAQFADAPVAADILAIILPHSGLDGDSQLTMFRLGALVARDLADESSLIGAVRFRQQQYEAALEQFDISARKSGAEPLTAWEQLFLAMTCHHLGQTERAGDAFKRALEWIDANSDIPWTRKAEIAELRRQAATLLTTAPGP